VNLLSSIRVCLLQEQDSIVWVRHGTPIFFLEDAGVVSLHQVAVIIILPVLCDLIDEKKRQYLDPLRMQALLLIEVLADGATYHFALHGKCIHVAPCISGAKKHFTAWDA